MNIITLFSAKTLAKILASMLALLMLKFGHTAIEEVKFNTELQETRYKSIIADLRCLVCQNQNLADSNADLAIDLKNIVHDMIKDGRSDTEIMQFMTDRYGDFVLYNPPLKATTYLLWFGPLIFLIIGLFVFLSQVKKHKRKQ